MAPRAALEIGGVVGRIAALQGGADAASDADRANCEPERDRDSASDDERSGV
jgi:hypothetical protein